MIIDFGKIEETVIPHFKGGEKEMAAKMFFDGDTRILTGRLAPGASIGLHTHEDNCEVMFINEGSGYVIYDGEKMHLKAGDVHYCPLGHSHTLVNDGDGDLSFSAVVPKLK